MKNKIIIIFLFLCQISFSQSIGTDTLAKINSGTIKLFPKLNPWLYSSNPAGHIFNPAINPGQLSLNYLQEKGDYKAIMQGDQIKDFNVFTERYQRVGKAAFYGQFSYNKSYEHGTIYSLLNNPYRETPYLLIDTTGRYDIVDREFFTVRGDISAPIYKNLSWGFSVNMKNGLSTQDRDPRPRDKFLNIDLSQGFIFATPKIKLGLNALYSFYNEDIEVEIIEHNVQLTFLQLHSFDSYTYHIASSFNRLYKRNTFGGEAQANYTSGGLNTILGAKFLYFDERADDGRKANNASWSYIKNDSRLLGNEYEAFSATTFRKNDMLHSFYAKAWSCNAIGAEYLRRLEQIGETDATDWIDYGSEEKYSSSLYQLNFSYSLLFLNDTYAKNWEITLGLNYFGRERAYYLPDRNDMLKNRTIAAGIAKTFRIKKHELALGGSVKMKKNTATETNYNESAFLTEKLIMPDFIYYSSDYIAPAVSCAYSLDMNKLFDKYFIKTNMTFYRGNDNLNRTILNFSTGVIFKN